MRLDDDSGLGDDIRDSRTRRRRRVQRWRWRGARRLFSSRFSRCCWAARWAAARSSFSARRRVFPARSGRQHAEQRRRDRRSSRSTAAAGRRWPATPMPNALRAASSVRLTRCGASLINGYRKPTLSFYSRSAGQYRVRFGKFRDGGPFYCPADQGVYLDTDFFNELESKFGAAGDAAQAYVIAHEVGHHIQTVSGISDQVRRAQQRAHRKREGNALQVSHGIAGRLLRRRLGGTRKEQRRPCRYSKPATWKRRCAPPTQSATIR